MKRKTVSDFFEELNNLENTIYAVDITNNFEKSLRKSYNRNLDLDVLLKILHKLAKGEVLDRKHKMHKLKGNLAGIMECHVLPDWLLLWRQDNEQLILLLLDTGTHSDLYGKNIKYK